ncbi:methyl-accepting chemotaxis protein [Marinimicrobium alkaliphilum]|uniref:methyl-accepting chemotaxis protein n=1 Tax=Marinimicrobium alkaliphilum TaxID=2202654 RepID=UPI0018E09CBC|nr:methyl-accepting chemotaxis protein [Marinimicrobium alkaliphilum]
MQLLRQFSISQRLMGLVLLTLIVVVGLLGRFAFSFHTSLLDARAEKVQHMVEAGMDILAHYHAQERAGALTRDEAQSQAATVLGALRYDADDYFWIHTNDLVMVRHPFSPHLDGRSIADIQDPNGKYLFREMNREVRASGQGFVNYYWPMPGHDEPVEKISYVQGFQPWDWVLGTGVYLNDVRGDFWAAMAFQFVIAAIGVALLIGLSLVVAGSIVQPLRRVTRAMADIASGEGDLTRRLDTQGKDELVALGKNFNQFTDKLSGVIERLREVVGQNREISEQVEQAMTDARTSYDRQKKELDTVASAVEEMSITAQDVAQRITETASSAQDASKHASSGQRQAQSTRDAMEHLAEEIASTSQAMAELDQQSQTIGGVLDVIHGVAEQTNLLALNAAIEAARAGEQGRGFAVVADEVRTLASRTQSSTDEIREMIGALQKGTGLAVTSMSSSHEHSDAMRAQVGEVKAVLAAIFDSINTITDMTHHIATAAEEQSQTANEVAASLNKLSQLSDRVLVELNDTAGNTQLLNQASRELDEITRQFRTARD